MPSLYPHRPARVAPPVRPAAEFHPCASSGRRLRNRPLIPYALATLALTACDRSHSSRRAADAAATIPVIAVISPAEENPRWPGIRGGVQRCAAGVPSVRVFTMTARENTSDSLHAATELALAVRARAVCFLVDEPSHFHSAINLALAHQVLVITLGAECSDSHITRHLEADWAGAAELLGGHLERIAAGGQSYLLLHHRGRAASDTRLHDRFLQGAQRQYGVQLLQSRAVSGRESAADAAGDILGLFRHAALLVTLDPQIWLAPRAGWWHALREQNANFRFATLSTAPTLWRQLGTPADPGDAAALVGPLDGDIGFAAASTAIQLLLDPASVSAQRTFPCELVTADTLADFARRYSDAANGLDVRSYLPRLVTATATATTRPAHP
jgi:hypothetical protein